MRRTRLEEAIEQFTGRDGCDRGHARRRRADDHRRRSARSRARRCVPRHEHVPAAARGEALDEHDRLDPDRARRAGRHRLHRPRRPLRRHRPRALGRRRHGRPRLRLRARSGRAADQRDVDHHRRHRRVRGDAGRGRDRLHGPDREQGTACAAEGAQLRRTLRLLPPDDPHRYGQHVLLPHPGDQRAGLRKQDQAGAGARRLGRRLDLRDHCEPGRRRDGDDAARSWRSTATTSST